MTSPKPAGAVNRPKPEPTRLPAGGLLEVAELMTAEAEAHDDDRWRHHSVEHHLNAAWRHLLALQGGEEIDPDSGFPHRTHATARLLFAVDIARSTRTEAP